MEPDLFFGEPDINCEGSTNLLVVTLPMWGTVKVTQSGVEHLVQVAGEMELTLTPDLRTGPPLADPKTAVELDPSTTTVIARRWTATVTSSGTPPAVAALITGNEFRTRFEAKFRQGVLFGKISLPSIDASFLRRSASDTTSRLPTGCRFRCGCWRTTAKASVPTASTAAPPASTRTSDG